MAEKTQYRPINDILKNPADREKLQDMVDEAVLAKQRIQETREHIKAIKEAAKGDLHVDPKMFTFFVDRAFNNDYGVTLEGLVEKTDLLENLLLLGNGNQ